MEVKREGGKNMNTSDAERDWVRRICGLGQTVGAAESRTKEVAVEEAAGQKPLRETQKKGHGFGDVAGMEELKKMVTEGFINVLQNREYAEAYGIKPPAMLFMVLPVAARLSSRRRWPRRSASIS